MIGAGYGTWEARQKGERPIVKDENLDLEGNPVSCLTPKYDKERWVAAYHENDSIFHLPGQEEKTNEKCGKWVHVLRCPDHDTKQTTLDGHVHDSFVATHSCHNPDCYVCYGSWASRQAEKTSDKMIQSITLWKREGLKTGRVDHVVFSPPQEMAKELIRTAGGFRTLRTKCKEVMKKAGVKGSAMIFHPFRQNDDREPNYNPDLPNGIWYLSPHFHVLSVGYLMNSANFYELTGWAYKKMEKRETIKGTIKYILSHCGIADGFQAIVYTGIFSNNSIVIDRKWVAMEPIKCKTCGKELHEYAIKPEQLIFDHDRGEYIRTPAEIDYNDDLGVYLHKVEHRIYKIRDSALKEFRKNNPAPQQIPGSKYVRIDDREINATKSNILSLIAQMKAIA